MRKHKLIIKIGLMSGLGICGSTIPATADVRPAIPDEAFDCIIEPFAIVKLASSVEGLVRQIDVDRGDTVRKGQIVARLDSDVEEATVALSRARANSDAAVRSSRAKYEFLKKKQDRAQRLRQNQVVSEATLDEAETETRVAELNVKEAEINLHLAQLELKRAEEILKQRIIRSTVDGVVVERLLSPGEYRNEQSPILTIAQTDPLKVEAFIPTRFFGRIAVGQPASVTPEEPIGGVRPAKVTVVDRVFDAASGTFGVRLELANPNHQLPAGLKCRVLFGVIR